MAKDNTLEKASQFFSEIEKNSKDIESKTKAYVVSINALVYRDIIDHFKQESGPDGSWKPWSPSYKSYVSGALHFRKIKGRIVPLKGKDPSRKGKMPTLKLQDSGKLRQSFTPEKWRTSKDSIVFYNNAKTKNAYPYAWAHDEGDGRLPARPFMWVSDKTMNKIFQITLGYLIRDI